MKNVQKPTKNSQITRITRICDGKQKKSEKIGENLSNKPKNPEEKLKINFKNSKNYSSRPGKKNRDETCN
uniref:Uncharacterized protein n=1 Tax=Caenorhabditis tropicalis TaxID=1561998 RepID=A0A1I7UP86_9PELO